MWWRSCCGSEVRGARAESQAQLKVVWFIVWLLVLHRYVCNYSLDFIRKHMCISSHTDQRGVERGTPSHEKSHDRVSASGVLPNWGGVKKLRWGRGPQVSSLGKEWRKEKSGRGDPRRRERASSCPTNVPPMVCYRQWRWANEARNTVLWVHNRNSSNGTNAKACDRKLKRE